MFMSSTATVRGHHIGLQVTEALSFFEAVTNRQVLLIRDVPVSDLVIGLGHPYFL